MEVIKHLFTNGVLQMLSIGLLIWQNWKIEKIKTELNKTQIKFTTYHKLQVEALTLIYDSVITLTFAYSKLLGGDINPKSMDDYKKKIYSITNNYAKNHELFHRKRILLSDDLQDLYRESQKEVNLLMGRLVNELTDIKEYESNDQYLHPQEIMEAEEKDVPIYHLKLKEDLKDNQTFSYLKKLNKLIVDHFKEMNK